jgi:hypothetical protein
VAGYSTEPNSEAEPVLQDRYEWETIRAHVRDLHVLNSVEDQFGCDGAQGRAMFDRLGETLPLVDQLIGPV